MRHETPDPPQESVEAIADRTPLLLPVPAPGEPLQGVAVLAAVAEGFRAADLNAIDSEDDAPRWGPLALREVLGAGTFGEVHRAWDPALQRDVALKLRRAEAGVLRWLDEGRALARVRHPNVVVVHGADLREGRAGIWMEHIEGRTLEDELRARGPLPVRDVARIGLELSSAVQAVHASGLTHGDIKAANVMLEPRAGAEPRTVLMDFGTVRDLAAGEDLADLMRAGTPLILAPEVLGGEPATARSDVYALGALLFRLLTGRYPVESVTLDELRLAHASGRRAMIGTFRRDVPGALVRVIERSLSPDPALRFASARDFHHALIAVAEPARVWRRRVLVAGAAASLAALLASAVLWILRPGADINLRRVALPRVADSQWARLAWSQSGAFPESQLGWAATGVGDLNGDGCGETAVSEAGFSGVHRESGRVQVFFGSPSGPESDARWQAQGTQDGSAFGSQLTRAGDVNGDGHPDLLTSERYVRNAEGGIGAVHLFLGDGKSLGRAPAWTYHSRERLMLGMGDGLAGGFDANADGFDDVIVGETLWSGSHDREGIVRLFLGGPHGLASEPSWTAAGGAAGAQLGWRCAAAGDVDHDGYDDVIVSAPHWTGRHRDCGQVRLYRGGPLGLSPTPAWAREGSCDGAWLGMSIAGGGDVNGDGFDDVVLGEYGHSSNGMVMRGRILMFAGGPRGLGSKPAWQWRGPCTNSRLGYNSILIEDLDADGFAEIGAGATGYAATDGVGDRGMVAVFRGGPRGPAREPDWYVIGSTSGTTFGGLVASAQDTDGDGTRELLIGEPHAGQGASWPGRLEMYRVKRGSRTGGDHGLR